MSNDYNGMKRSELPDSVFGIPQERKYPMPDEKHTRSAIKLFNHVDPKYEEQLAKAVIKNMKKYGIDGSVVGPNNRLRKYLPKDMIEESMDSLLYEYIYTDNDPGIIIQESGYALTWRIMPILLKAVLSGVDQYDYKYLREKKLPAILKKCKTMDDIKYMRRDAITAKTQLEILKRNVHAVNTNDEQIMKRLNKSFIKKVKDGKITEKEIDTHIRWLNTEYKKLIDARAKEIKDSIKESYIEEGYFKSDKDIYYNKDKFDSGEINLCFITGLSGSGKSTMGRGMSSKDVEHYEMDDIICNYAFSDDNLKEYGGLVESFFKGPGKDYRLKRGDEDHNNAVFDSHENYEKEITQLFVKHAISYCKSHKGIKYVCDGIWIFMFIKPEQLKDCAVYIKGTSSIKSGYRALKRDINEDKRNGMTSLQIFKHEFKRVKEDILYARENQKELKSFRSYFEKQSTNESVSSTVSKDHKQKGYISLSSLKKVHITESVINKYKKEYPVLRHVRCKDTDEYICDGYMWFKENDLVCYVGSCQYTDDHTKWIVSLEIIPKYRGYGLSNQILDYCVKSMKCKYLSVNKNNELAKKIYDKYGFRVYHEDNTMYYMTIDKSVKESSILPQDTGISTVIFDIGDVLVSANIKDYLVADPEVPNEIVDELLKLWFINKDEVDDTMDLDTYREIVNKRMGVEFSKYIPKLFKYNVECVTAFNYTIPMIQDLKDKGYKVYYLSNWSAWTHDLLQKVGKFDFLKLMDGGVFSYDVGYMKPNEEIYKILLNKYKINPEEAIFFDDKEENIEAANKLGIHGIHFPRHDASIVYDELAKLNKQSISEKFLIPTKINEDKIAKEIESSIKSIVMTSANKSSASKLGLTLKCKLEDVDSRIACILILDGSQDKRDTDEARTILKDIANKCKSKLGDLVSKVDIGDGDEGCLYFTMNKKYIVKNRKDLIQEYGTTGGIIVGANQPLYFYHMVDSGANLSKGLLSLGYMYHHNKPLFLKNASKYRNRLCDGWGIYPGRDPKSLTAEEIYEGIKKFRNEDNLNSIYFFKYPPYSSLDKRFDRLYKYKKLYRININDTKVKSIIKNINYGWVDSNTYNDPLDRKYYETVSPEDYFNNFDPDKGLLFSTLYHISIEVKNGYIPMRLLEEVKVPNTIEDIISMEESSIQEYGTTGGTIVGANQPDSVYIVNYMQNNVFSGYKEPKQAICKKGMNQMYTTKNGKAVPVDKDKFKEEASDISVFRFKETPILSFDKIIENASVDTDFYLLLTGDFPEDVIGKTIEYDNRFVQEENFLDELDDITCCTESTITGQIETSNYPYMKVLTESVQGRCWNYYRDINGVFAMNELTGLRTPSYENAIDIPRSQIKLIERGTVYLGE